MDALLQLILILVAFALLIFLISRSVRWIFVVGMALIALAGLELFGVID